MSNPTALQLLPHALRLQAERPDVDPRHAVCTCDECKAHKRTDAALRKALPALAEMADATALFTGDLHITVTATGERTHVNALLEPIAQRILDTLPADIVQAAREAVQHKEI